AASPTATTSNPSTDSSRAFAAVSLACNAPVATTKRTFGKELSTVKLHVLVRVSVGVPLSLNTSITQLLDRNGKTPGGTALMVVRLEAWVMDGESVAPFSRS